MDDNQLAITFRTVFEELISEQTRLPVAVRVQERCSDSSPEIPFLERNVDRTPNFGNTLEQTSGRMKDSNPDRDHPPPPLKETGDTTYGAWLADPSSLKLKSVHFDSF